MLVHEEELAPGVLVRFSRAELVAHFCTLASSAPKDQYESITLDLISKVHTGAIPAEIFGVWFPLAIRHSPGLLRTALFDQQSNGVWTIGIRSLSRILRKRYWKERGWDAIGGLEGICTILDTFGAAKARSLLKLIGCRLKAKGPEAERLVDGLARFILLGRGIDMAADINYSGKPLSRQPPLTDLVQLLRSCSVRFLTHLLSRPLPSNFPVASLLSSLSHHRISLLRAIAIGLVEVDLAVRCMIITDLMPMLISAGEPYAPRFTYSYLLPPDKASGVYFCLDVVQSVYADGVALTDLSRDSRSNLLVQGIDYAVRHKMPFDDVLNILRSGLSIANSQPGIKITLDDGFTSKLLTFWGVSINPDTGIDIFYGPKARKRLQSHPSRPKPEHKDALQGLLVDILQNLLEEKVRPRDISSALKPLKAKLPEFEPSLWLPFIKLMCRFMPGIQIDLDQTPPSEEKWARLRWSSSTLDMLSSADFKWLFERISSMDLESKTLDFELVRSMPQDFACWYGTGMLKVKWDSQHPALAGDFAVTYQFIEELKKKARNESDSEERCQFTKCTISAAVGSMDVSILKDVITWSRRFIRDPQVFGEVLTHNFERTPSVLACIPLPPSRTPDSLSSLTNVVREANEIIRHNIETAILWRLEPNYDRYVSGKLESFLTNVIKERIQAIRLGRCLGIGNEEELANILLHSLIPICIELEQFTTSDQYNPSKNANWCGPLNYLGNPSRGSSRVLAFLDELAKLRDELWAQLRLQNNPYASVLPDGWPRGLPVQALLPSEEWATVAMAEPEVAPYVSGRLNDIIFCDSKIAQAEVPAHMEFIGKFVDSLPYAARAYIGKQGSKDATSRFWKVWKYYAENVPVTARQMEELGIRVLDSINKVTRHEVAVLTGSSAAVHLPSINPGHPEPTSIEWEPCVPDHPNQEFKFLDIGKPSLLDERLVGQTYPPTMSSAFVPVAGTPQHQRKKDKSTKIWNPQINIRKLSFGEREALALSSILYLNTLAGTTRILTKPFPENTTHPRYPALFLSYDFLSQVDKLSGPVHSALNVLTQLIKIVPPALLKDLGSSLLESLLLTPKDSPKNYNLRVATIYVIELLSLSDQPQMSIDLGLKVIQDMPDASSWHRMVIPLRLLKGMDFADSERMLLGFKDFVVSCLERMKSNREAKSEPQSATANGKVENNGNWVKVTTIKMLAQLVRLSPFLSHQVSLNILQSLFAASQQKDVRKAIVFAFLVLLTESIGLDGNAAPALYAGLRETLFVVVGPSEKSIVSESDWEAAEHDPKLLPPIDDDRPLFDLVTATAHQNLPSCLHGSYVRDVVLPCLDESTRLHNRWMRIFIQDPRLAQAEKAFDLDFGPFPDDAVDTVLLNWSEYLPQSYLMRHRSSAMKYLELNKLQQIEKSFREKDHGWNSTSAGKHWLSYMNLQRGACPFSSLRQTLNGLDPVINRTFKWKAANGITTEDLADEYFQRITIVLRNPEVPSAHGITLSLRTFHEAVRQLHDNATQRPTNDNDLISVTHKLFRRISGEVDGLRTRDWLDNPARKPAILPSSTFLHVYLLPFPGENCIREEYEHYTEELVKVLDECARSPFCFDEYNHVETVVLAHLKHLREADLCTCAIFIGTLTDGSQFTTTGCLRVRIASKLIKKLGVSARVDHPELDDLFGYWTQSPNEWIRTVGWEMKAADAFEDGSHTDQSETDESSFANYDEDIMMGYSDDEM